jgi:tRNA pseudouridine38-40 synthase
VSERNIRLLLAFDGTGYSGWQRQKNAPTIQGEIERCLQRMTGEPVILHGAGRTDAGVHALGMVANFRTRARIPCPGFHQGLNSMLPTDIRILDTAEAPDQFHSRYSAAGKTYRYTICTARVQLPTERLYATHIPRSLDATRTCAALDRIIGSHDFSSFEGIGSRDTETDGFAGRGAVRTLYRAEFTAAAAQPDTWLFRFTGNGFLRHMVRNLVGTLLLVGSGKITPDEFAAILRGRDRTRAGATAPAHGLLLEQVLYEPIAPPC